MSPMFYFLLALTAVSAATTANAGSAVLDMDGDLIYDGSYYVRPFVLGQGGGLTFSGRGDQPCPLDIVREPTNGRGIPVKFSNWRSGFRFVTESENLNIEMDIAATVCFPSTYWWVDTFDEVRKNWFIKGGPKPKRFGEDSSKSFFQIVKAGDDYYKFRFCPSDCAGRSKVCSPFCMDVGMFVDENGVRRLALGTEPFLFRFTKANVNKDSSKIMSV